MPATRPSPDSVLDRPAARLVAGLVFVGMVGLLGWLHRDDLFPKATAPAPAAAGEEPAFLACLAQRTADVDRMLAEKLIDAARAEAIRASIEGICRSQTQNTPGGLPGLPQVR